MKVVLFCGGMGMRIREVSHMPKPMVEVGLRPVMWHLMRYYAHYGHKDFIICLGYKGDAIKRYFLDYDETVSNDFTIKGGRNVALHSSDIQDWTITFVDTGTNANVGQRLMAVKKHLQDEEVFLANYADGLCDFHLPEMQEQFMKSDKIACFLSVRSNHSFHIVESDVQGHVQRILGLDRAELWTNGGYFILRNSIFDHMEAGDELVIETFNRLITLGKLMTIRYEGFWMGMDTFKEKQALEEMYLSGDAPWEVWKRSDRALERSDR